MSGPAATSGGSGIVDFLIVGAGSAGCVLAHRLSATGAEVRLVEAGPDTPPGAEPDDVKDLFPRSYFNNEYMWPGLVADQSAGSTGQMTPFPQARIMGGGSSLMGMIALRGLPDDYDGWAHDGARGWGWADVLPYFRRLETDWDFTDSSHGADGPVPIRRHRPEDWPLFVRAVGEAAVDHGWPMVADMNGDFRDGFGRLPMSNRLSGRVSAAAAYLTTEVRRRPNLTIATDVMVERLLFEGTRCVGASAIQDGRRLRYRARHVIVSAGAIHSPIILMRSGVGPAAHLRQFGIDVVADVQGVGAHLQNHPVVYLATHVPPHARQSPLIRPQFNAGLRYSATQDPELRGDLTMLVLNKSSWHGLGESVAGMGVLLAGPKSRGSVRLASADPRVPPRVDFRMLTDPSDHRRMVDGLATAVDLMTHPAVVALRHELFAAGYSRVVRRLNEPGRRNRVITTALAALLDGPAPLRRGLIARGIARGDVDEERMRSRSWQERTVLDRSFGTYHPSCTCKIGSADDPSAVLDERCSVRGVEALSVVDASVMPTVVRANTNVPVMMIAERAADLLTGAPIDHSTVDGGQGGDRGLGT